MTRTTLNDRWLRVVGLSFLMTLYLVMVGGFAQPLTGNRLFRIGLGFGIIFVYWHALRALILFIRSRYPAKAQAGVRVLLTFLAGIVVASVLSWGAILLRYAVRYGTLAGFTNTEQPASFSLNHLKISFSLFGIDLFQSAIIVIFYQVIYETFFFIQYSTLNQKRLRQAEQEREKLRSATLQSQLDALKQQVNPHFLFNSLNVLDSLIDDDPQQARVFLDELSTVYRYLLRANEHHLTDLASELDFIHSYFHLLKTRHGVGLHLNVQTDSQFQTYRLPPLTLQLLVENAVKHNIILPERPLTIYIQTNDAAYLQISNNIQRKTVRVASTGIGLTNILTKYQMLNQPAPVIQETNDQFLVILPLIEPDTQPAH